MLASSFIKEDYKHLIGLTVCSLESKNCMLQRCDKCPGKVGLELYLADQYKDFDPEETIDFKQWIQTDRAILNSKQLSVEDFIEELATKISDLSIHHFVSKHQTQYLKMVKENLKPGEVVVLLDFAENYSFVIQDAVQGFHWENSQATVHPIVVYYILNGEVQCKSTCIIRDCLKHNTIAVHVFLVKLIDYLKSLICPLKKILYFSDGSAAQYKNYKNFVNLCYHHKNFGIGAEWNFFATSHGKSPCDGVGGTVKRLAARASLQRPTENQILTPIDLFTFCDRNLNKIKFFFVKKEEIEASKSMQQERFEGACTVAGTRENHQFIPIDTERLHVSRVSGDAVSFIAKISNSDELDLVETKSSNLQPGQYVACIYDDQWWIGNICDVSLEEHDALINFMHPHGPARSFFWPSRKDSCWIPEQHIFLSLLAPTRALDRQYNFPESGIRNADKKFALHN